MNERNRNSVIAPRFGGACPTDHGSCPYRCSSDRRARRPSVVAERIASGELREEGDRVRAIVSRISQPEAQPLAPLILVAPDLRRPDEEVVVLEGHARLTAYLIAPEKVRWPLAVLAGYSHLIRDWPWF